MKENVKIFIDFHKIFIEFLQAPKIHTSISKNETKFHNFKHVKKFYFTIKKM